MQLFTSASVFHHTREETREPEGCDHRHAYSLCPSHVVVSGLSLGRFRQQFGCQSQGSVLTGAEIQLQSSLKPLIDLSDINIPFSPQQWLFFFFSFA